MPNQNPSGIPFTEIDAEEYFTIEKIDATLSKQTKIREIKCKSFDEILLIMSHFSKGVSTERYEIITKTPETCYHTLKVWTADYRPKKIDHVEVYRRAETD